MSGAVAVLAITLGLTALANPVSEADAEGESVGLTRIEIGKWLEARKALSKARNDWALGKELLEDRIDVLEAELASVRTEISEAGSQGDEEKKRQAELETRHEQLKAGLAVLEGEIAGLERRSKVLVMRLPPWLRDQLAPLAERLPDDPEVDGLTLAQRFQSVVGILDRVTKASLEIKKVSERRELADGTTVEVSVVYLGISQGFYVDQSGEVGGVGVPGDVGWDWTPVPESAGEIARLVAVLDRAEAPAYVKLPSRVIETE